MAWILFWIMIEGRKISSSFMEKRPLADLPPGSEEIVGCMPVVTSMRCFPLRQMWLSLLADVAGCAWLAPLVPIGQNFFLLSNQYYKVWWAEDLVVYNCSTWGGELEDSPLAAIELFLHEASGYNKSPPQVSGWCRVDWPYAWRMETKKEICSKLPWPDVWKRFIGWVYPTKSDLIGWRCDNSGLWSIHSGGERQIYTIPLLFLSSHALSQICQRCVKRQSSIKSKFGACHLIEDASAMSYEVGSSYVSMLVDGRKPIPPAPYSRSLLNLHPRSRRGWMRESVENKTILGI